MAIVKKENHGKRKIDISGPQGNAFFLLGTAAKWAKQMELDTDEILGEMKSGDYEHLIKTFDKYFGCICDLER